MKDGAYVANSVEEWKANLVEFYGDDVKFVKNRRGPNLFAKKGMTVGCFDPIKGRGTCLYVPAWRAAA